MVNFSDYKVSDLDGDGWADDNESIVGAEWYVQTKLCYYQ